MSQFDALFSKKVHLRYREQNLLIHAVLLHVGADYATSFRDVL